MSISDLMEAMAKAGAPMEAILLAVRAIEAKDAEISARRANDRERKQRQRAKVRNEDGTVTGQSRDKDGTVTDTPLPSPSPSFPPDPQTNPTPAHPRDENTPRTRKADDFPKPEWADPQVWADFLSNRKAKKARNTVTAYRGFLADIERHTNPEWPPGRLLEHAAAKGWAGIYEPDKDDRNELPRRTTLRPAIQQSTRADRYLASIEAAEAERGNGEDYPQLGYALPSEFRHQ